MGYKGGDHAEFGIIDVIDPTRDYGTSYEPERYGCITVCDDAVEDWQDGLKEMKSYFPLYEQTGNSPCPLWRYAHPSRVSGTAY